MKKFVRIIGLIFCAAAGVSMVLGVLGVSQVGSCGDIGEQLCPTGSGTDVIKIIAGSFLLTIGAIMTMGVGVFAACAGAAITLLVEGHGAIPRIIASVLIGIPALILLVMAVGRRRAATRAVQTAEFKQGAIMVPGIVTAVRHTGLVVNDNPRITITVAYQRTDGVAAQYERTSVVNRFNLPNQGEKATVWYEPNGPKVVVERGEPAPAFDPTAAYAAELARSVGVADALPTAPFQNAGPEDSVPGSSASSGSATIVAGLERLAALHRDGSLSEYEYTLAKQRLLNGS